jgi:hypothetical protein
MNNGFFVASKGTSLTVGFSVYERRVSKPCRAIKCTPAAMATPETLNRKEGPWSFRLGSEVIPP